MSTKEKTESKAPVKKVEKILPLVENTTSFNLIIPEGVEAKIRHLCSVIHDVEWSGTLFYTYSGSIDDGTFEITCRDLYVMDIGSSGYTEYSESVDILSYRIDHDLLTEDVQEGLIHSHNRMSAFFSGTDQSTLGKEGRDTNHFLSLIVNNAGNYVARFTRKIVKEIQEEALIKSKESSYYNTFGNIKVPLSEGEEKIEKVEDTRKEEVIEFFNLNIRKQATSFSFQEIDDRLSEIRKAKVPKYTGKVGNYGQKTKYKSLFDTYESDYWGSDYDLDLYRPTYDWDTPKKQVPKTEPVKTVGSIFDTYHFDKKKIETLALQLLTGSIIINSDAIKLAAWVPKMDLAYKARFGDLNIKENKERLVDWIDGMLDFITYEDDEKLEKKLEKAVFDDCMLDVWDFCIVGLYEYLDDIEFKSDVLELMLDRLGKRLPDEAFTV